MALPRLVGGVVIGLLVVASQGCWGRPAAEPPRKLNLYQNWAVRPGDEVAGYPVQGGLGDIAVDVRGRTVYMPFNGRVQPEEGFDNQCVVLSSPEVPAYLFRICGLRNPNLGEQRQGDSIGSGDVVAFATLRKQTDGTWAMVEPAKDLLAQFLSKP
jgi:hypothetical protein